MAARERLAPGAVVSPLLANLDLGPLDRHLAEGGSEMVRDADDLVVLCGSQAEAAAALRALGTWVAAHGLTLPPEQTRIVDATPRGGFDVLGHHVERGKKWPSTRSERQVRDAVRATTGRKAGGSVDPIIAALNPIVRGWFGDVTHRHWTTFGTLDGWIRMRLRSILRWRRKGNGRGRGADQQRWPTADFVRHGLVTMQTARLHARRALAG